MLRCFVVVAPLVSCVSLTADHANITYIGRTSSVEGSEARLLGWAGVQAVARFSGPAIAADLAVSSKGVRFLVEIDGSVADKLVVATSNMTSVSLAKGLSDGEHTLSLWRISEDNAWSGLQGAAKFGGFSLPLGGHFLAAPAPKERQLEFWGDSNIAGWCADGAPHGSETHQSEVQNTYETWAARLARALDADFTAEAISGVGVTSYSEGGAMSGYIDGACAFSGWDWDYSSWTPQAIVIWLGLNDWYPHSSDFQAAYLALMEHAADKYAYAAEKPKLIHVCGSLGDGSEDPCDRIRDAIGEFNAGRKDGFESFYAPISAAVWSTICFDDSFQGCDEHYNPAGHELIKADLVSQIQHILGWSSSSDRIVFV